MMSKAPTRGEAKSKIVSLSSPKIDEHLSWSVIDEFFDYIEELESELSTYKRMVSWMEDNSNSGLCDYYNSEISSKEMTNVAQR